MLGHIPHATAQQPVVCVEYTPTQCSALTVELDLTVMTQSPETMHVNNAEYDEWTLTSFDCLHAN